VRPCPLEDLLTPALRFAAACSYLPSTPTSLAQQAGLLSQSLQIGLPPAVLWDQICRHRIHALADEVLSRHRLRSVLGQYDSVLAKHAQEARRQALILGAESARLSEFLSRNGIAHHILKGPQLSGKLYGDSGLRHSKDIDIIIDPRHLTAGLEALKTAGWTWPNSALWLSSRAYRRLAEAQLWHVAPVHPQYRSAIEVHWRFEQLRTAPMESKWWAHWHPNSHVVSSVEALHLCLHGAAHAWGRMKWLGDIRALLDREPGIWRTSLPLAEDLKLRPILAQAFLLLEWLYGLTPDAAGRQIIASEAEAGSLARFALQTLTLKASDGKRSIREHLQVRRYRRYLRRRHGMRARLLDFLSVCFLRQGDLVTWSLPPAFLFALPAVRVTGFIRRRWLRR